MMISTKFVNNNGDNQYSLREERVLTDLDPELQNAVLLHNVGRPLPRYLREQLASGRDVVDVIAKLRNPRESVEGLSISQRIGQIVTGVVEARNIIKVREDRNVLSLKGARRLLPTLANSVPEIRATPQQLRNAFPGAKSELNGTGVIVGIIDHGCDFAHPNFRTPDGDTRILFLWDQHGGTEKSLPEGFGRSPAAYGYGREFSGAALNHALREAPSSEEDPEAPHRLLNYRVRAEHGTGVMDVAAGNGGGQNPPGVAPGADIIFVDSSLGEDATSDASLGNSRHLLEAVKYVFDKARELKCQAVVNISLNYDGGPHDGSTPVEEGFDRLLETPGRAIVIAAGNSRDSRSHVRRMVHPNQTCTLFWKIPEDDKTDNKLEIWYSGRQRLEVTLRPPGGPPLGPVPPASTFTILKSKKEAGRVFNRINDSSNGDNHIALLLDAGAQMGVWQVEIRSLYPQPFPIHAWIEVNDSGSSTFADALPSDQAYTLGTIACGLSTIVASGYDVLDPNFISPEHAEGPTRDGKQKPEISAPAQGTLGRIEVNRFG
jgi:subtilisin family serine protease